MPIFYRIIIILLTTSLFIACSESEAPLAEKTLDNKTVVVENNDQSFRFFVNADPQMGPRSTERKGLQILNELLEQFVAEVNSENQKEKVDFVVYNGDLVWDPYQDAFDNFIRIVKNQEVPVKLVHGNHDGYNNDPKFFEAQQALSGFQKLNYSFSKGDWHFVFIGAQEKYLHEDQKKKQLQWLKTELNKNKDKKIMLFMHYHILPVGLSQMEFYSYWPVNFKKQMLDIITAAKNVKYVFSGHVHSGIKGSIKSSVEYKGIQFVNCPTPVMARPFGEEYEAFENLPKSRYHRRGFYLEVVVNGDDVQMIGHKINHEHEVEYPKSFKSFKPAFDPRFVKSESRLTANPKLINPEFEDGFKGWRKSYRYKKDHKNAFQNVVKKGQNILTLRSPWGSWSFDEYMETYQIVALNLNQSNQLSYRFRTPKFSKKGGGGFIKLVFFNQQQEKEEMVIFHWGNQEKRVKLAYQSWLYNADGQRGASREFNQLLKQNDLISVPLDLSQSRKTQTLEININALLAMMGQDLEHNNINKMSISHGVWARILMHDANIKSQLEVDSVQLTHSDSFENTLQEYPIRLNQTNIEADQFDKTIPYFDFENRRLKKSKLN